MSTPSPSLYHQRFDPRLQPRASPRVLGLTAERTLLQRLFFIPSSSSRSTLERAGVPRGLAWRALRRMRSDQAAHAYAAAKAEYVQHAAALAWITRSAAVTEYQALCALRAFPDPAEARDHVLHQTHRAAWAGCRFCEREARELAAQRRISAVSAVSSGLSGLAPPRSGGGGPADAHEGGDGIEQLEPELDAPDAYPPPCPPAIGVTPATPVSPSRPLTPASRSSVSHSRSAHSASRSDAGHTLKRTPSWTIRVQALKRRSSAEAPPGAFNVVGVRYAPAQSEKTAAQTTLAQHPAKEVQALGLASSIGYLPQDIRPLA